MCESAKSLLFKGHIQLVLLVSLQKSHWVAFKNMKGEKKKVYFELLGTAQP